MDERHTIYVVTRGEYSAYRIIGVYDDLPLAERVAELMSGDTARASVEEWTLNASPAGAYPPASLRWSVDVRDDGRVSASRVAADDYEPDYDPFRFGSGWSVVVWAPDEATARTVGQDSIARHKAERAGLA